MTLDQLTAWMTEFHRLVTEQRDYLTELDSAIGDADHGTNMTRGMTAAMAKVGASPAANAGDFFKTIGMTLVSSVGGASGPLYGTFFLRMGTSAGTNADGARWTARHSPPPCAPAWRESSRGGRPSWRTRRCSTR